MSMLFNFRPLVINPELATRIGLNEAIVLQQVNYWINDKEQGVIHSGRRWVFNSYESWVKQFPFWSADTVKRAFTSLVKQGCLDVEQLNKSQHDRTNYYTINHDCELLNDAEQVPSSNGASCPDRQVQDAPMDEGKNDAPRDKCAHFREINGIAAAFQHLQKNYNPIASSFL